MLSSLFITQVPISSERRRYHQEQRPPLQLLYKRGRLHFQTSIHRLTLYFREYFKPISSSHIVLSRIFQAYFIVSHCSIKNIECIFNCTGIFHAAWVESSYFRFIQGRPSKYLGYNFPSILEQFENILNRNTLEFNWPSLPINLEAKGQDVTVASRTRRLFSRREGFTYSRN